MKFVLLLVTLPVLLNFISCNEQEENQPEGLYDNGVFIINEGNFSDGDGSIDYCERNSNTTARDIFRTVNARPLAGLIQSLFIYNEMGYVVDQLGKIEKVSISDFKFLSNATGLFAIPRYMAAAGNTGFLSDWGPYGENYQNPDSKIHIINLNNLSTVRQIPVESRPEDLKVIGNQLFVAISGIDKVMVYDAESFELISAISVMPGPTRFVTDAAGHLWVVNTGNYITASSLSQINSTTLNVEKTVVAPAGIYFNGRISIDRALENLYVISEKWAEDFSHTENIVYVQPVSENVFLGQEVLTGQNYYGIGIDPENNQLYIADAAAFQTNGSVYRFDSGGTPIDTLETGRGPRDFVYVAK